MGKKILFFMAALTLSVSAFSENAVLKNFLSKNSPVGLVILCSEQKKDDGDLLQRKFIVDVSENTITGLFKDKIKIIPLNKEISQDEYFKKESWDSFFFDEIALAKIAKNKKCSSVLIIYYAYVSDENGYVAENGLKIHRLNDVYLYLFDTGNVKLIHSYKSIESFSEKIDKKNDETIRGMYKKFYSDITKKIFASE